MGGGQTMLAISGSGGGIPSGGSDAMSTGAGHVRAGFGRGWGVFDPEGVAGAAEAVGGEGIGAATLTLGTEACSLACGVELGAAGGASGTGSGVGAAGCGAGCGIDSGGALA
jgi:hypothetical protein